jgi:nucleotide-binding universal stress UspA family protein
LIVEESARWQSDLIVMATHGYRGLQRLAMGSVADRVLHATSIPLLLIHADNSES